MLFSEESRKKNLGHSACRFDPKPCVSVSGPDVTQWFISNTLGYIWFCLIPLKHTPTGREIVHGMKGSAVTDDTCCLIQTQTSAHYAFVCVSSLVSWWFAGKKTPNKIQSANSGLSYKLGWNILAACHVLNGFPRPCHLLLGQVVLAARDFHVDQLDPVKRRLPTEIGNTASKRWRTTEQRQRIRKAGENRFPW